MNKLMSIYGIGSELGSETWILIFYILNSEVFWREP